MRWLSHHRASEAHRTCVPGGALGRSLYVHLQRPLPAVLLAQGALVTAVALPVIVVAWRRGVLDRNGAPCVEEKRDGRP